MSSILGLSFGFLTFNSPVPLKAGDTVRVKSNCSIAETSTFTTRSTNFTIVADDATICNNTSNIAVTYDDIIRLFLASQNSEVKVLLNSNPLTLNDFDYQQFQTTTFSSDGTGIFKGTANTNNSSAFSKLSYTPSNTLRVQPVDGYSVVRFGIIELIFNNGELRRTNFASGEFDVDAEIAYSPNDVFDIISTNSSYVVEHNSVEIYTYSKAITLTATGGSISPNPATLNTPSIWTLPVAVGEQTVTAEFVGDGVYTSVDIEVDYCRATADDKSVNVNRGSNNNDVPTLTGTVPNNCSEGGARITALPPCSQLLYLGTEVELNDVIPTADFDKLKLTVPTACNNPIETFKYQIIASGSGCQDSFEATVTININTCIDDWQDVGSPTCIDCVRVQQQENLNYTCSGGDQFRYVPTGDNSLCTAAVWQDTLNTRCQDCLEQKEQENTNPCYVGEQTRWIANPGGSECETIPNWEEVESLCITDSSGLRYKLKTGGTVNTGEVKVESGFDNTLTSIQISSTTDNGYNIELLLDALVGSSTSPKGQIYLRSSNGIIAEVNISSISKVGNVYTILPVGSTSKWAYYQYDISIYIYVLVKLDEEANFCRLVKVEKDIAECSPTYNTVRTSFETDVCTDNSEFWVVDSVPTCGECGSDICNEDCGILMDCPECDECRETRDCKTVITERNLALCSNTYNDTREVVWNKKFETYFVASAACLPHFSVAGTIAIRYGYANLEDPCTFWGINVNYLDYRGYNIYPILMFLLGEDFSKRKNFRIILSFVDDPEIKLVSNNLRDYWDSYDSSQFTFFLDSGFKNYTEYNDFLDKSGANNPLLKFEIELLEDPDNPCSVEPNWVPLGGNQNKRCINCEEEVRAVDTARCSPTFNKTKWIANPGGNACSKVPNWAFRSAECIDCQNKTRQEDIRPCSPTFGQFRYIDTTNPNDFKCITEPNFEETELTKVVDGICYVYWINTNPCNTTPGEWREQLVPSIIIEDGCIPKTDPCKTTINIFKKCPKLPCGCNSTSTTTVTTSSMPKFEAKWGKVNTKNVIASNITNAEFSGDFIKGSNIIVDFPYITPEYLFLAEPATEDQKVRWYENPLNNEDIGANLVWELFGIVFGYRVYITSFKTFFSSPITFTKD